MILKKSNRSFEYTKNDYEFMNSLSAAVLEQTPSKISRVIKIWLFTIAAFLIWASTPYLVSAKSPSVLE